MMKQTHSFGNLSLAARNRLVVVLLGAALALQATCGALLAATATNQTATVSQYTAGSPIYLNGSGLFFELVSAPTNGTVLFLDYDSWTYLSWPTGSYLETPITLFANGWAWYVSTNKNFVGTDSFVWAEADDSLGSGFSGNKICTVIVAPNVAPTSNPQTVHITIANTNWTSILLSSTHADSGGPQPVLHNMTGQTQSWTVTSLPTNGLLTYSPDGTTYSPVSIGSSLASSNLYYRPSISTNGTDSFRWFISDPFTSSAPATCTILIDSNASPVANTQTVMAIVGTSNNAISLSYTHADHGKQPETWTIQSLPTNGTLTCLSGSNFLSVSTGMAMSNSVVYYTPTISTPGTDTFTWCMSDPLTSSAPAICTILIKTNSPPVAYPQTVTVFAGTGIGDPWLNKIALNYTHADSGLQPETWTFTSLPTNGTLNYQYVVGYITYYLPVPIGTATTNKTVYYTPNITTSGNDTFSWFMSDGITSSAPAVCSIIIAADLPPVIVNPSLALNYLPNTSNDLSQLLQYTPGFTWQALTPTLISGPTNGTLIQGGTYSSGSTFSLEWTYVPNPGFTGADGFVWSIGDGILAATGVVTIAVSSTFNNPPVIAQPSLALKCLSNSTNDLSPFLVYTHADTAQTMTYTVLSAPTNGTLTQAGISENGTTFSLEWTYAPNPGFTGGDSFIWSVSDGIATATGVVTITVSPALTPVIPVFKSGVKLMSGTNLLALGTQVVNGKYDWAGRENGFVHDNKAVMASPDLADWDNNGLMDLVVGQADGRIALIRNKGAIGAPKFNGYEYLKLTNGKQINSYMGGCLCTGGGAECPAPRVVDWNNDGKKDLILGEWCGPNGVQLLVYLNCGSDASPAFDHFVNYPFASSSYYPTAMPWMMDWNGNGFLDLISGDNPMWNSGAANKAPNSSINVYLGTRRDHSWRQGQLGNNWVNAELYNWNNAPVDSFQSQSPCVVLANACPTGSRKSVASMTRNDGSGLQDLIIGMQDGTVLYAPNTGTRNFPVYTNYFSLQAGGSNIIIGSSSKVGKDPAYPQQQCITAGGRMTGAAQNEARITVGDLDGDGLADLVVGDVNGNITVFYQYNPLPVAQDQNVLVMPNYPKAITLTARVDSGHTITFNVVSNALNGQLSGTAPSLTYTPNPGYTGTDRFSFIASDGPTNSRVATVWITVRSHTPVAQWTSPVTLSSTAILNMNTPLVMTLTATDDGNEPLNYTLATQASNGTVSISGNQATYTPNAGYTGPDSFTYCANNGYLSSAPATVNLDVCVLAVNFQPGNLPALPGFLADTGAVYNATPGYGWIAKPSTNLAQRNCDPNPMLDRLVCSSNATWQYALSNGSYWVSFACGDAAWATTYFGPHQVALQGASCFGTNATTITDTFLFTNTLVIVSNGLLTAQIGDGVHITDLNYILVRNAYRPAGAATYITEDTVTQGAWMNVYGGDGYKLVTGLINCGGANPYLNQAGVCDDNLYMLVNTPPYAVVAGPITTDYYLVNQQMAGIYYKAWALSSSDPRALQYPGLNTGVAAMWNSSTSFNYVQTDINFTDGQTHQVAVYCLSWGNNTWTQRMDVVDAVDNTVLNSRTVSNFGSGKWEVWNISGHVRIRATSLSGTAAISGIFFGPSSAPATILQNPNDLVVQSGQIASFQVGTSGSGAMSYQWQSSANGGATWTNIPGATAGTYAFVAQPTNNGCLVRCAVSNLLGSVTSAPAKLTTSAALPLAPAITSPLLISAVYGQNLNYTIQARNNPVSFDAFLPPNWNLDVQSGTLSISPAQVVFGADNFDTYTTGTEQIPIWAYNAGGFNKQVLTVMINPTNAPVINSALTATAKVGSSFSYQISATWSPTNYSVSGLPAGLTYNASSGLISGTPLASAAGSSSVQLSARNANGTGYAYLSLLTSGPPTFQTQPANSAVVLGQPASFTPVVNGDTPMWFQWALNGTNINGATGMVYSIAAAAFSDAGVYVLTATNYLGLAISSNAMLTVASNIWTLTTSTSGAGVGSVTLSPSGGAYVDGTLVTLTAFPGTNSVFTGWSGALSGMSNPATLTMNGNCSVTANFGLSVVMFPITASAGLNGSISPSGTVSVAAGGSQTFTITPATYYAINSVTVDGPSVGAPTSYTFSNVQTNHAINATFRALLAPLGTPLWWLAQYGYASELALDPNGVPVWKDYLLNINPTSPGTGPSYNIVPYGEGFENLNAWGGVYTNVVGSMGWYSSAPGVDQSAIVNLIYTNIFTNLPLPSITHTNVLQLNANGAVLSNSFGSGFSMSNSLVYMDLMMQFGGGGPTPSSYTLTDSGLKGGFYLNTNRQFTVYHGVASSSDGTLLSNTLDATSVTLASGTWHRVTWMVDATATNPANALAMFQVCLDGTAVSHANAYNASWKTQFQNAGTLPLTSATGTWFRFATTNAWAKTLTALYFVGTGYLDDVAVTTNNPFALLSGPYRLIVTSSGNGFSSLGTGPYLSAPLSSGANTQIVYTAAEWNRISTLASNGVPLITAVGARSFTQQVFNISADISNAVAFAWATQLQTGYTNVPTSWLTNWTEEAIHAAQGCDGFCVHDKYILGLDPTSSNSYRLMIEGCSPSGSNVVIVVRRDVSGLLSSNGMGGSLILQAASSMTNAFTNLPAAILTGPNVFDATGHRSYTNTVDNANKYYKVIVQ